MAGLLKVEYEELNRKANEISTQRDVMENWMNSLRKQIEQLTQDAWAGDSGTAYRNQFENVFREIVNALNRVQTHVDNINEAARQYAEQEGTINNDISGLPVEEIK